MFWMMNFQKVVIKNGGCSHLLCNDGSTAHKVGFFRFSHHKQNHTDMQSWQCGVVNVDFKRIGSKRPQRRLRMG